MIRYIAKTHLDEFPFSKAAQEQFELIMKQTNYMTCLNALEDYLNEGDIPTDEEVNEFMAFDAYTYLVDAGLIHDDEVL